jgi:hypothetical protein
VGATTNSPSLGRRQPLMKDHETTGRALPCASIGLRVPIAEDRDRAIHPEPAAAMAMLETRGLLAQNAEFGGLEHLNLRYRGRVQMVSNKWSVWEHPAEATFAASLAVSAGE